VLQRGQPQLGGLLRQRGQPQMGGLLRQRGQPQMGGLLRERGQPQRRGLPASLPPSSSRVSALPLPLVQGFSLQLRRWCGEVADAGAGRGLVV